MGCPWQSFHFICDWETKIELSKTRARIDPLWNLFVDGRWSKRTFNFTNFQLCSQPNFADLKYGRENCLRPLDQKLCAIYVWNFARTAKNNDDHKWPLLEEQIEESFQNTNLSKISDFRFTNMKRTKSPKVTTKVLYELLKRSHERFEYFWQT